MTKSELPALRVVRPDAVVQAFYGFGDASGKQFGAIVAEAYNGDRKFCTPQSGSDGLTFWLGVWTAKEEWETSNFKEFENLVATTEAEARSGRMRNCEFFLFAHSTVAEACFHRGSSKSTKLHGQVVRLRVLEMEYGILMHLIHVSGTRMIARGTDGCSRGFLMEWVMAGQDMLHFVDLAKSAVEQHPGVLD